MGRSSLTKEDPPSFQSTDPVDQPLRGLLTRLAAAIQTFNGSTKFFVLSSANNTSRIPSRALQQKWQVVIAPQEAVWYCMSIEILETRNLPSRLSYLSLAMLDLGHMRKVHFDHVVHSLYLQQLTSPHLPV